MDLCHECEGLDSSGFRVERDPCVEAREDEPFCRPRECSKCKTWMGKPHFLLQVLHGRLAEPVDLHRFEMKPSLWSSLPQECLQIILARLPLGSRVRFSFCLEHDYKERKVDFGVWELESSPSVWLQVSFLPEHLQEMLLPVRYLRRSSVQEPRYLFRRATFLAETLYFTIEQRLKFTKDSRGYDNGHGDRTCKHLVGYNILDSTWSLICKGVNPLSRNNSFQLFWPNDVRV